MAETFWLNDRQWARPAPLLPDDTRGVPRVDDRRVISGIIHVLPSGCRWRDAPAVHGPYQTLDNRFVRWARKGVWEGLFRALAEAAGAKKCVFRSSRPPIPIEVGHLFQSKPAGDSCEVGRGGVVGGVMGSGYGGDVKSVALGGDLAHAFSFQNETVGVVDEAIEDGVGQCRIADAAYASNSRRRSLIERGSRPVIPNHPTRKHPHPFDRSRYKLRNLSERTIRRLKDWRRLATRYDKLAANFLAAVTIASSIIFRL